MANSARSVEHYSSLQALRAVAALAVVAFHLGGPSGFEAKTWGNAVTGWAYPIGLLGVDLFFIVSGFIMVVITSQARAGTSSAFRFLGRRLSRIYPAYLVATLAVLGVFLVRPDLVNSRQAGAPDLSASLLLLPQQNSPLLMVGWTLVHEAYFYLVFGLALIAPRRYLPRILAAWGLVTIALHGMTAPDSGPWVQMTGSLLNLDFLLGAGVAWLVLTRRDRWPLVTLGAGLAGLAATTVLAAPGGLPADWLRVLGVGTSLAIVVLGLVGAERRCGLRPPRFLTRVGDSSYSLYLTHVPLLGLLAIVLAPLPHVAGVASAALVCVGVGWAYYRVVELPGQALARRLFGFRSADDRDSGAVAVGPVDPASRLRVAEGVS